MNPYDPALGGINCDEDCTRTANGLLIQPEHYGTIAACHPSWMGCQVSFRNDYGEAGPFTCQDTGGALLAPKYVSKLDDFVQYVDILWDLTDENGDMIPWSQLPWWNHAVFDDYEVTCNITTKGEQHRYVHSTASLRQNHPETDRPMLNGVR